jgi:hypothetical protein
MNTNNKLTVTALALVLALAVGVQAAAPGVDDRVLAEAAERAQLQEISAVLADPDARERFPAVHALVNLASGHATLPDEISDLLHRAARDPDPEIARFASDALYQFEMRAQRLADARPEVRPDAELQEIAKQREIEEIAAILNDPRSRERYGAAHALVNLASSYQTLPIEVRDLLERARTDDDFEIARLAETVLAARDGRPMDQSFIREPVTPMDAPTEQKSAEDPYAELAHSNPNIRYGALVYLMEIALGDGLSADPEILKAFSRAMSDPDPKVRAYAEFAVNGGLVGDENAVRQVYVGTTSPGATYGVDRQPPSLEQAEAKQHVGYLDEHGVFIGVTEPSFGAEQQPLSLERADALQHEGSLDKHGVFIGVTKPSYGAEQPQ